MATARDNKEVPVIKSLFEAFHQNSGFAMPPESPYKGIQIEDKQVTTQQDTAANCLAATHSAPPQFNIQASTGLIGHSNGDEKTNTKGEHGFITSLVTKELKSSTPSQTNLLGPQEDRSDEESHLRGVARDKWSLFWHAYVEKPVEGDKGADSIVDGVKQEAIFLGKFPSKDQAGRAHDIAALKILGDGAETNFPKETYNATIPIINAHSNEEVVAALMKDSELARQRTSKFKGVRRTAQGQFEARADLEVVSPMLKKNGEPMIADSGIGTRHHTATFNA